MPLLATSIRTKLEEAVEQARRVAEVAARSALESLAVQEAEPYADMDEPAKRLRGHLRAGAEGVGDPKTANQRICFARIVHDCAYEHWSRMLFARFLAENHLLIGPESNAAISLDECEALAAAENTGLWTFAGRLAQRMLPGIFRPGDPLLQVTFAREDHAKLESILAGLERAVFMADNALGWVYQFWRAKDKDAANKAGGKIDADTLPAVTQLFTEHYMVEFLLHNTLGAWWTAKSEAATRASAIPLPYLLLKEDGSPAAGAFPEWPKTVRELRGIDPCCGSGHILVALLRLLVAMRREEEGFSAEEAVRAVLTENLHGLEIDERCCQVAAFNLAFAAWKLIGRPVELPALHVACSGLSVVGTREEWFQAVDSNKSELRFLPGQLYEVFRRAPDLGSLINPGRLIDGFLHAGKMEPLLKMLDGALAREDSVKRAPEAFERGIAAQGMACAVQLLAGRYHLTTTNVPYLGRGNQGQALKEFIGTYYPTGKQDLATAFILRCLEFCAEGGTTALVTPQNWLFLAAYKKLREHLLESIEWHAAARLGAGAFETIGGEVVNVALLVLSKRLPSETSQFAGIDVSGEKTMGAKALGLQHQRPSFCNQRRQLQNPDARVILDADFAKDATPLGCFCRISQGSSTGDDAKYVRRFWEVEDVGGRWKPFLVPTDGSTFGGRSSTWDWPAETCELASFDGARVQGFDALEKRGFAVCGSGRITAGLYHGEFYNKAVAAFIPRDPAHSPAIWAYLSSNQFEAEVRTLDQKVIVTPGTFSGVPFDLARWEKVAAEKYPPGLPRVHSDDPTQWLFSGHPRGASEPLQVAVARLLGYQWPRKTGSEFPDCVALGPDGLEALASEDGIVCLSATDGEAAADRLQRVLAAAYGADWSSSQLEKLLTDAGRGCKTLEDWLRVKFFEQHCGLFRQRPLIWQIWDGLPRGFSALVNYHRLAAPNGVGRKLLEKLTHIYLGDWISRQSDGVRNATVGAGDRLAAALELKKRLVSILEGDPPFDIFARWKPLRRQAIGWEPDINDGVRMNIRPFMASDLPNGKRGAGILRIRPNVKWDKDRGKEPRRPPKEFPWFWGWDGQTVDFPGGDRFTGERWNGCHFTSEAKRAARSTKETKS
jgi:hypothetical protein